MIAKESTYQRSSKKANTSAYAQNHHLVGIVLGVILLVALVLAGCSMASPSYVPSSVGMENVVIYNDGYHIPQGTPYIVVPFNITLSADEIARGFFIREDSQTSSQSLLSRINDVKLAVDGWNDIRGSDNKISASSSTSDQFEAGSVRIFVVNLSTVDLAPGIYSLGFRVATAWSSVPVATSSADDWQNAECTAVFSFTVEGNKTIHYEGNGATSGSMADQIVAFNSTVALTPISFSRTGYDFNQWNTRPDGTGYLYYDGASYVIYDDLTLYAQWAKVGTSSISGTISNASGYDDIYLQLDGSAGYYYGETVPAVNTTYRIDDVARGAYNLKAEYTNGTFTYSVMYLVDVVENQPTVCDIVFPNKRIKASVNISTTGSTPNILVGGLNEEVESQAVSLEPDQSAELSFSAAAHSASEISDDSAKILQKIRATHPESETDDVLYLNLTLPLIIRNDDGTIVSSNPITTTNNVLEVCIPYDFSGKSAVYLYRLHDGVASELTGLSTRPTAPYEDGTYYLDTTNGFVRVYADKYSTYSAAYTKPVSPEPSPSHRSGYTTILPETATPVPTAVPTATPVPTAVPTAVPTDTQVSEIPMQSTAESPVPVAGIIAGLGAAAFVYRIRK